MEIKIAIKRSTTDVVVKAIAEVLGEKLEVESEDFNWRLGIQMRLLSLTNEFQYTREFLRQIGLEDETSTWIHEDAFEFDTEIFVECRGNVLGEEIMPQFCDVLAREISRVLESDVLVKNSCEGGVPFRYYSSGKIRFDFVPANSHWLDRLSWIPRQL